MVEDGALHGEEDEGLAGEYGPLLLNKHAAKP